MLGSAAFNWDISQMAPVERMAFYGRHNAEICFNIWNGKVFDHSLAEYCARFFSSCWNTSTSAIPNEYVVISKGYFQKMLNNSLHLSVELWQNTANVHSSAVFKLKSRIFMSFFLTKPVHHREDHQFKTFDSMQMFSQNKVQLDGYHILSRSFWPFRLKHETTTGSVWKICCNLHYSFMKLVLECFKPSLKGRNVKLQILVSFVSYRIVRRRLVFITFVHDFLGSTQIDIRLGTRV